MNHIVSIINFIMSWPIIFFVIGVSILVTISLNFIQLRYFIASWKYTFNPSASEGKSDMSPFQAFINTLNISIGNGSLAGMATAVYSGGPGAALWTIVITFLLMPIRYSEVYLSTHYAEYAPKNTKIGGPMLYLKEIKGGALLSWLYAAVCVFFGLVAGSAMQANSISLSVKTAWGIPLLVTAIILTLFILYAVIDDASRIVKFSEKIVPLKVGLFFISALIILLYHYQSLVPALQLIVVSGFSLKALSGGVIGYTVQEAMRYGILRSINATESGIGTVAILFGSTGSRHPVRDGIMAMASTLVSAFVCFIVALCIIASGVWDSGHTSTALTIASYNTVFGTIGGWIVAVLSISFGVGVLVSYAYITKAAWDALTKNRFLYGFVILYSSCTFIGAYTNKVTSLWASVDVALACMLSINLIGIVSLIPQLRKGLQSYKNLTDDLV